MKHKQLKNWKKKKKKDTLLYERNGKVYDIYTGKVFKAEDCFDKETKRLKKILKEKYG